MGEVFAARQEGLAGFEKLVVLKTLRPDLAERQHFRDMFFEEARVSALVRHANVVSVVDVGIDRGIHFIVMEYIEGWSVRQVLDAIAKTGKAVPLGHALTIAIDVARGLEHVHGLRDPGGNALRLVHRDVSPDNVMITVDGLSKLVDFGIAKRRGSPIVTEPGVLKGKARYLAPEQVRGGAVSPATDQFALASVLFEICTGEPLFPGKTTVEVMFALGRGVIRDPHELRPDLPDPLVKLLHRALSREPADRYPSCADVAEELVAVQGRLELGEPRAELIAFLDRMLTRPAGLTKHVRASRRGAATAYGVVTDDHEITAVAAAVNAPDSTAGGGTTSVTQVRRLIGRSDELGGIRELFDGGARLVTLLGPGGVGKTSLASHFAYLLRREGSEREIYFCDLSDTRSPDALAYQVAEVLSVPLTDDLSWNDAVEHVGHALAGRTPTLLILDNAEQIVDAAATAVSRWLDMAPNALFLATSRESLNVSDEQRMDIQPLPRDEAVELLCQRVRAVRPGWSLGVDERTVASQIVDRLDRLPLAIELAAARGGVLSMSQLLRRLSSSLDWLRSRRRDISVRHASLIDTIAWSWELLTVHERDAMAQCSVFRGGFTLTAAESVIAVPDDAEHDVIDLVQSLREKSLLYTDTPRGAFKDELRFRMYESIRSFAGSKLDSDERDRVRDRHLAYYMEKAEYLAKGMDGQDGASCLDMMAASLDNVTAALDTAQAGDPRRVIRLVLAVERLLAVRGPAHLHGDWLSAGLDAARQLSATADVARLLKARGLAATRRGEYTDG
ncbi:MAG: protein kinase, partial [Myxococcota bacterium]